jgi:hypothetical protein
VTKNTVAREWLYLLGFIVGSLVLVPFPVMLILNPRQGASGFYRALFDGREWFVAWLIVIAPYLAFQLVRSVLWAVRTSRK